MGHPLKGMEIYITVRSLTGGAELQWGHPLKGMEIFRGMKTPQAS